MNLDPSTTKYLIRAKIVADGIVEKPDVVGAIFGQTEGLIGDELDLRDLQKSGRVGRIEVEMTSHKGKSEGEITMPSSLDQVETAILASGLETIERVGPCNAKITTTTVEDVRASKKNKIIERAKELLLKMMEASKSSSVDLTETVRQAVQTEEIVSFGTNKCPAGPNVETADSVIIVEGRSDILNLLKHGIKNAIAVEGTNIPKTIQDLSKERVVTAFLDGDRGGDLILRELLQVAEVDFIARAPKGLEVEELTQKQMTKSLRNKIPTEQYVEMYGLTDVYKMPAEPLIKDEKDVVKPSDKGFGKKRDRVQPMPPKDRPKDYKERKDLKLSPEYMKYRETLNTLSGSQKAKLLNTKGDVVREVAVRDLADALRKAPREATAVVFDGIITQRLLDNLTGTGIKAIVGVKLGNITKQPAAVEVIPKTMLE
ncbi:MAG: DNA primase [Thermoplasmata archaeon]|nr:MAG: DNA primase [Thermoplasmata archaeon]